MGRRTENENRRGSLVIIKIFCSKNELERLEYLHDRFSTLMGEFVKHGFSGRIQIIDGDDE